MIVRLLLVVLVMLNLSAAAWWLFHRDHALLSPATTTNAVPALKLVDATHAPPAAAEAPAPAIPADAVCASFGPFADAAAAEQAKQQLRPQAMRVDARQVAQAGHGYDVVLAATDTTGSAMFERLKTAGIKDMFVIRDGADAGGVALGHFGSQEGAQRRLAELQGKGFQPRIRPSGQATFWLDVVAANGFDSATVRTAVHAPRGERVSCPAASG
ncbi:MAG: hypothetical protein JF567_07900 [Xanthomonadales bacterium]|nr:hypothetical protein [Xanthomonadales bacterium]